MKDSYNGNDIELKLTIIQHKKLKQSEITDEEVFKIFNEIEYINI